MTPLRSLLYPKRRRCAFEVGLDQDELACFATAGGDETNGSAYIPTIVLFNS